MVAKPITGQIVMLLNRPHPHTLFLLVNTIIPFFYLSSCLFPRGFQPKFNMYSQCLHAFTSVFFLLNQGNNSSIIILLQPMIWMYSLSYGRKTARFCLWTRSNKGPRIHELHIVDITTPWLLPISNPVTLDTIPASTAVLQK